MKFHATLDINDYTPPPAMFVRVDIHADGVTRHHPKPGERVIGSLMTDEETARALAERINGEPWPASNYHSPYSDDNDVDE